MRCANDHDNADAELFCCECGVVMPPLGSTAQIGIRWFAETEPPTLAAAPPSPWPEAWARAKDDAAAGPVLTRAELRRRRRHWPRRLRRRAAAR